MRALIAIAIATVVAAAPSAAVKRSGEAGAGPAPSPTRANIVLITVDSLRADRLGCYGAGPDATPGIDALAARGVRFTRAYAASASTTPSNASILTGLYPIRHGLRHDLGGRLAEGVPTLAERLKQAGYTTGAVVGSVHLDSDRGLERGFGYYGDDIKGLVKLVAGRSLERRADEVRDLGLQFMDSAPAGKPFFLWLNLYDPHQDHEPPAALSERFADRPYEGEVAHVDAQVTALLRGLRARDIEGRTHIVLAGTHGEGLGDHGESGHGIYLFESTIRVPLLFAAAGKGMDKGRAVDVPVSLVDVAPTILALAGADVPSGLDGLPLVEWLQRGAAAGRPAGPAGRTIFVEAVQPHEAYGWSPLYAVLRDARKVVAGRRLEAFDLGADPGETAPLGPNPPWAAELERYGRPLLGELELPEARRRQILEEARALNLPWDNSPMCLDKQEWPDPREPARVALNEKLFKARVDSDQEIIGRAAIAAQEVLESDAANYTALDLMLRVMTRRRWQSLMQEPLEVMQCNYPFRGEPYHYYGHYLEMKEQYDKAAEAFRMLGRLEPWKEDAEYDLAAVFARTGKLDQAFGHLERSIRLGSTDFTQMWSDTRLVPLWDDPRFVKLAGPRPEPAAGSP